jgi:hypothetical protein
VYLPHFRLDSGVLSCASCVLLGLRLGSNALNWLSIAVVAVIIAVFGDEQLVGVDSAYGSPCLGEPLLTVS